MYKRLEHARVERSRFAASSLRLETDRCTYRVSPDAIRFNFNLASEGGWGYTDVLLTIGVDDLPSILDDVAESVGGASRLLLRAALHADGEQSAKLRHVCAHLAEAIEQASQATSAAHRSHP